MLHVNGPNFRRGNVKNFFEKLLYLIAFFFVNFYILLLHTSFHGFSD